MRVAGALREWLDVRGRSLEYVSFAARRATGLFLAAYLVVHMFDISVLLLGEEAYNSLLAVFHGPLGLAFDVLLVVALSLHGALGACSALLEAGLGVRWRRQLYLAAWLAGIGVAAATIAVILYAW